MMVLKLQTAVKSAKDATVLFRVRHVLSETLLHVLSRPQTHWDLWTYGLAELNVNMAVELTMQGSLVPSQNTDVVPFFVTFVLVITCRA